MWNIHIANGNYCKLCKFPSWLPRVSAFWLFHQDFWYNSAGLGKKVDCFLHAFKSPGTTWSWVNPQHGPTTLVEEGNAWYSSNNFKFFIPGMMLWFQLNLVFTVLWLFSTICFPFQHLNNSSSLNQAVFPCKIVIIFWYYNSFCVLGKY